MCLKLELADYKINTFFSYYFDLSLTKQLAFLGYVGTYAEGHKC